jgi:hypothetical protein
MEEEDQWTHPDPAVDAAWAVELRRPIRALKAGKMRTIPLEQALDEADRLLADDDSALNQQRQDPQPTGADDTSVVRSRLLCETTEAIDSRIRSYPCHYRP